VKDFLREYWKSAAAGAAGAFLLSLLVGLVTRNPFGVVFARALLLALLFAGFAAALRYLVRTHLLEAAREGAASSAGGADTRNDRRGGRVDIVLPEESPPGMEGYGSGRGESRPFGPVDGSSPLGAGVGDDGAALDSGLGDMPEGLGAEETASEGLGELTEELGEELPQSAEDLGGTGDAEEDLEDAAAEEESGERWSARAPSGGNAAPTPEARPDAAGASAAQGGADVVGRGPRVPDDRDGLPDISNLEIAVQKDSDERGAALGSRPGGQRPQDALRGAVSGQDPLTIARAIRTVLKRDDKG